jgi:hypothetical protein
MRPRNSWLSAGIKLLRSFSNFQIETCFLRTINKLDSFRLMWNVYTNSSSTDLLLLLCYIILLF